MDVWQTALGVGLGGTLTMLSAYLADRRSWARERERRRDERREKRQEQKIAFQRETLLALQTASQKLLRNAGASLHSDAIAFKAKGTWRSDLLPEALDDGALQLITEMLLLTSRIADDEVKVLAEKLREQIASIEFATNLAAAETNLHAAANTQRSLLKRTGLLLVSLDETET